MTIAESTAAAAPFRFRGTNARYVDIAARNEERIGLSVEYAAHPSNVGCFILRFVAHGQGLSPANYKHLTYRESAKFLVLSGGASLHAEVFKGTRLNKIAIKAFDPAVKPWEVDDFALKFDVWLKLSEWVAAQVLAEGFTLIDGIDLYKEIRESVVSKWANTPSDNVKSVLEFPDLAAPEQQAAAMKLVKKPEPEPDDEDPDADEDEDSDDDPKGWLN